MKFKFDLHTHTIASGHAYNTIQENIDYAYRQGLAAYGFSDHGPAIPGAPAELYFRHFRIFPRNYRDMQVFCGIEANILNEEGQLDIHGKTLERVDYIIASMHSMCIRPGTLERNMRSYIQVMQNPHVKIIGHPDDSAYPLDYQEFVRQLVRWKVVPELNESSLDPASVRRGVRENMLSLLSWCRHYDCPVICGSDAHHCSYIGHFERLTQLLQESAFPEDLVLNSRIDGLRLVINRRI